MIPLLLMASASADPCEDALSALARGAPPGAVARVARTDDWDPSAVDCLIDAAAPRRVVVAAARAGSVPVPVVPSRFEVGVGAGLIAVPRADIVSVGTVGAHAAWLPAERVALQASVAAAPRTDNREWKAIGREIRTLPAEPTMRVRHRWALDLQLAPVAGTLRVPGADWRIRGTVDVGAALVSTLDDVDYVLQMQGEPDFERSRSQVHPALHWGATARLDPARGPQLRLSVEQSRWVEVIRETWLEQRQLTLLQAGVAARFR